MPIQAKECRDNAYRCSLLAEEAATPSLQKTLQDLAATWIKLAVQLENLDTRLHRNSEAVEKRA